MFLILILVGLNSYAAYHRTELNVKFCNLIWRTKNLKKNILNDICNLSLTGYRHSTPSVFRSES